MAKKFRDYINKKVYLEVVPIRHKKKVSTVAFIITFDKSRCPHVVWLDKKQVNRLIKFLKELKM